MKNLFIITLMLSGSVCYAQSSRSERIEINSNQSVQMQFDEATIIHISGWKENYINIEASVSINDNTQNDAYVFEKSTSKGVQLISGNIVNKNSLPQIIRIKKGDEVFTFHTDDWNSPEIKQFYEEHGKEGISWKSHGVSWEISLTIKVPENLNLRISSKHGMIELEKLLGKIEANSVHGGIDLSVNSAMKVSLDAKTKWGEIYSNLPLDIDKKSSSNRDWNHIIASVNGSNGPKIHLESRHANIYLRKK